MKYEHTPKALRLADALEREYSGCHQNEDDFSEMDAAAELRRLHALNQELLEALKELLDNPAGDYDTTDDYANACKKACAAVAKATGGAV